MADASFETEVRSARELLQLQRPSAAPAISPASLDIDPDDYVPPRFARKQRSKVRRVTDCPRCKLQTILDALSLTEVIFFACFGCAFDREDEVFV